MEEFVDIIIKAISDFGGDLYHRWVDITITATPDFAIPGITIVAVIASFFIIFMMEADS